MPRPWNNFRKARQYPHVHTRIISYTFLLSFFFVPRRGLQFYTSYMHPHNFVTMGVFLCSARFLVKKLRDGQRADRVSSLLYNY